MDHSSDISSAVLGAAVSGGLIMRAAQAGDCALILHFIRELAEFEKESDQVQATEASLRESLFCAGSPARALICERAGEPVGYAVYFFSYSTWQTRKGLYLEDLYVTPSGRGRGTGRFILQHLAAIAVAEGCGRFEWSVLDWNQPAIDFYQSMGAVPMDEWVRYRLHGSALQEFAASGGAAATPA